MLNLFVTMFKRGLIEMRRYAFDTISGMVTIYVFFMLIFRGAQSLVKQSPGGGDTLSAIIVGFMVWTLALFTGSDTAFVMSQEAQVGTLEQLAMSRFGLVRVVLARFVAGLFTQLLLILALLVVIMASTGKWLNLDLASVLPLMLLTIAGVQGVGLIMGGLAVIFKRVQNALNVFQFLFVAIIAAPLAQFPFVKYLPLKWGNEMLNLVMVEGRSILEIPAADIGFLIANSFIWLAVGALAFRWFESVARTHGKLAHY